MPPTPDELAAIARAKARLDRLRLYPVPVRTDRVRILHTPWLFRVPGFRRFRGYEAGPLILTKRPLAEVTDDLIVHELCHVWQSQHRHLRMWLSYLCRGYRRNPYEEEAREAVRLTRGGSGYSCRDGTGRHTRAAPRRGRRLGANDRGHAG